MTRYRHLPLLAGVAVAALATPAQAQTGGTGNQTTDAPAVAAAAAAAAEPAPAGELGEIVVTAQKRAENVQDIPKSVQVISPALLRQTNVTQISDLRNVSPSFTGTGGTGNTALSIRGVATSSSSLGSQNKVGLIVDDVPQISNSVTLNQLVDVERVEVLPGPQGTLSGRNATGGLINIVNRGPTRDLTANADVTGTTDHQLTGSAFVAGPLTDTLAFSLSGYHDHFRGVAENITLNKWLSRTTDGVRGKLQWKPTSNLTVLGTLFHEQTIRYGSSDANGAIFEYAPPSTSYVFDFQRRPFALLQPGVTPSKSNTKYAAEVLGKIKAKSTGGILKADYDLGPATLTYVGSHSEEKRPEIQAFIQAPRAFVGIPIGDGTAHVYSGINYDTQELRIASPTNDRLNFIAGVIYTKNINTFDYQRTLFPVNWTRRFSTEAVAGYAHVGYNIVDALTVTGGLRYEADKASYVWHFLPIPGTNPDFTSTNKNTDRYLNYDIGAQFRPAERIMLYATYAKASQGQIFDAEDNGVASKGPLSPLPSEEVKDIEAGIKSTLLDGRMRFNVNLFDGKYRNYQVSTRTVDVNNPSAAPVLKLASVGRVETKGVEVSSSLAATSELRLDVAGAYTDSRYKNFPNAPCYTGQTLALGCVPFATGSTLLVQRNLAGSRLAGASKWKVVTTAAYTRPLGASGTNLEVVSTVRYQSAQIRDVLQDPNSRVAGYAVVNLSAGLRTDHWYAQLFVNNLFDAGQLSFTNSAFLFTNASTDTSLRSHTLDRDVNRYGGLRMGVKF